MYGPHPDKVMFIAINRIAVEPPLCHKISYPKLNRIIFAKYGRGFQLVQTLSYFDFLDFCFRFNQFDKVDGVHLAFAAIAL